MGGLFRRPKPSVSENHLGHRPAPTQDSGFETEGKEETKEEAFSEPFSVRDRASNEIGGNKPLFPPMVYVVLAEGTPLRERGCVGSSRGGMELTRRNL